MSSRKGLMGCCLVVIMTGITLLGLSTQVSAADYEVGDSFGWNIPPNSSFYSDWASSKSFFIGDNLVFNSSSDQTHTVAGATQAEYDSCTNPGLVFSTSSVFRLTLTQTGPNYFLCTIDNHCEIGQKFSINVSPLPGAAPAPSSASSLSFGAMAAALLFTSAISLVFWV